MSRQPYPNRLLESPKQFKVLLVIAAGSNYLSKIALALGMVETEKKNGRILVTKKKRRAHSTIKEEYLNFLEKEQIIVRNFKSKVMGKGKGPIKIWKISWNQLATKMTEYLVKGYAADPKWLKKVRARQKLALLLPVFFKLFINRNNYHILDKKIRAIANSNMAESMNLTDMFDWIFESIAVRYLTPTYLITRRSKLTIGVRFNQQKADKNTEFYRYFFHLKHGGIITSSKNVDLMNILRNLEIEDVFDEIDKKDPIFC